MFEAPMRQIISSCQEINRPLAHSIMLFASRTFNTQQMLKKC